MRKDFKKNVVSVLSVLSIGCAACGAYVLSAEVNDTLATAAIEQTQTVELKGDFVMKSGASVRKEDPKGIRFSTYVKESVYSENNAYGTLIIPAAILGEQALTEEVTSAVDVKANVWADSDVDGYKLYHSVLTKIPESYYGVELVARSYVVVDGEYEFVDEAQVRSIAQVAASALVAGEDDSAKVLENYVDKAVKSFTLDITEKQSLKAGDTLTLTATAQPSYAMLWNSSNEKVATVKDGVVTAVGEGTATISVKLGSKVLSCEVEVGARQFANVGKVSVSEENGALVWAKVAATDNAEFFADSYAVTLTNEKGEVSTCQVSENAYLPYTLAEGVYTITVKATDSKGYVASSENSSEEYKFVVARHADYVAADMPEEFTSSENGTNVKYDEESGYAVIRNEREYGLITTKKGISLNMAINPIIVMDTVAGKGYMYFKGSFEGSNNLPKNDNGKYVYMKDTDMGEYAEDRYVVLRANTTYESGELPATVENFKIYPGLCQGSHSTMTLRGIYILSVSEYVEAEAEQLETLSSFKIEKGVVSANKLASAYPNAEITYTVEVTGEGVDAQFTNLSSPALDLTSLQLTNGSVYTVTMIANGDGTYYSDSEPASVQIVFNEIYNVSDFTNESISHRDGNNDVSKGENGLSIYCGGSGNYSLNSLNIDMTGKRITTNTILKVTFGEVTNNAKYWTGFFLKKSGGGDRDTKFEDVVTTGSSLVLESFYENRSKYIIDNVLYYGFGMGGSDSRDRRLTVQNVMIADYAFYPCEASASVSSIVFDKSNASDQTIGYTFQNGGELSSVKIDGSNVEYTNNEGSVTVKAEVFANLSYGAHTLTLKDKNGYFVDVALTVMNSVAVSYEKGRLYWISYDNATTYKVSVYNKANNTLVTEEIVNGTQYTVAEKNFETNTYNFVVSAVYANGDTTQMGSVSLNFEKLIYISGKLYNKSYKEGGSDKTQDGARAEYREAEGVTRVIAAGNDWGCVFTDDLKVNGENLTFSENSFLCITMGKVTNGYYVRLVRNGDEKWATEEKKEVDSVTMLVSAKDLNVELNKQATFYLKLGSSGGRNGYVDYKTISVCNISVAN